MLHTLSISSLLPIRAMNRCAFRGSSRAANFFSIDPIVKD